MASIERDDPFPLPGMHRAAAPACTGSSVQLFVRPNEHSHILPCFYSRPTNGVPSPRYIYTGCDALPCNQLQKGQTSGRNILSHWTLCKVCTRHGTVGQRAAPYCKCKLCKASDVKEYLGQPLECLQLLQRVACNNCT